MEQLNLLGENQETSCVFTGHRDLGTDFNPEKLRLAILEKLQRGVTTFYCGMAVGFDLLAAELLLSMREEFPAMKLVACIPCEGQDKYFSDEDKMRYRVILYVADETVVLADRYYRGCMQARDRYMVDKADCMITYCTRSEGGTAYTVRYCQKKYPEKKITFI